MEDTAVQIRNQSDTPFSSNMCFYIFFYHSGFNNSFHAYVILLAFCTVTFNCGNYSCEHFLLSNLIKFLFSKYS